MRTTARTPAFKSRRTWPPTSTSTSSTKAWPMTSAKDWLRSNAPSSVSPRAPMACRSRAVRRSRTSASRYSRRLSGRSRKSARWTGAASSDRLCEILASEHADEDAVGVRDHDLGEVVVVHALRDRFASCARPDRARPEQHDVFRAGVLTRTERLSAEKSQNDAFFARDHADLPPAPHAFGDG